MANSKPILQNPQQRAIVATTAVFILLGIFAFFGYWYGKKASDSGSTALTNSNTAVQNSNTVASNKPQQTAISGKITKILENAVELQVISGETTRSVLASITKDTILRKLDFRTIPKNGVGDGVAIKKGDLKVGLNVVVITTDSNPEKVNAQKVNMVIYP